MVDTWLAVEARTGFVIADLPLLTIEGDTIAQTIGRYETATAYLPVAARVARPDWQRATKPGATFLVLLDDNVPIWGALINRRKMNESGQVQLDLVTGEGYFDRRYVTAGYSATGQNAIFANLISTYIVEGAGGKNGIPIRVVNLDGVPGTVRDRTEWDDQADKTVYSAATDLSGVTGGPEWTTAWEWADSTHLGMVAYVGARIGASPIPGLEPAATFTMPGSVISFEQIEDYSSDSGANDVMAVSSGEGNIRPQSPHQISADPERPTFEYRWTPSTSISDVNTLIAHAQRALAVMRNGTTSLAMVANYRKSPRLGVDWNIGDDVGYDIKGSVPAFAPDGLTGTARVGGWERTLTGVRTVTPILIGGDLDA